MNPLGVKERFGPRSAAARLRFAGGVLARFAAAHAFALLPVFWTELGWWPDQVKVYMAGDSREPPAVSCNGTESRGERKGRWERGCVFRFYLLGDMEWNDLAFRLPEGQGPSDVHRIDLEKWKLFRLGMDGSKLEPAEEGPRLWRFGRKTFDHVGFVSWEGAAAFLAVEGALLALSALAARRRRPVPWKTLWKTSALAALPLVALLQVALPLQTYLVHRSVYPFSLPELLAAMALGFPAFFVLATVATAVLAKGFGRWVPVAVLALAACVYLESGLLSIGLAELTGNRWAFQTRSRALWDAAVWAAVFALAFLFRRPLSKRCGAVSLVLLVLAGAAVLDAEPERRADASKLSIHGFCDIGTAIRSVSYSTNRNVLVFILDSLEREAAHAAMDDPEAGGALRGKFPGFTEYVDNVGACAKSLTAVANLLTGNYPGDMTKRADFYWSVYSGDSALRSHLDAGNDVFATTPALGCGFASRPLPEPPPRQGVFSPFNAPTTDGRPWTLRNVTRFRASPYAAKSSNAYYLNLACLDRDKREWTVYPLLARAPVRPGSPGTFLLVHTDGVHVPVLHDRYGGLSPDGAPGDDREKEMAIFLFGELGRLFDAYRERGLYDNSLIFVLADHGQHGPDDIWRDGDERKLPRKAKPFLWVKPPGATHPFASSRLPTSHAQIAGVLKTAARRDPGPRELEGLLRSDERLYRWIPLHGNEWRDWVVHRDGTLSFGKAAPSAPPSAEGMVPVRCDRDYWLSAQQSAHMEATVVLGGIEDLGAPVLPPGQRNMTLDFKAPDPDLAYTLRIAVSGSAEGTVLFRQAGRGDWVETPVKVRKDTIAVLPDIRPDADGLVRIEGRRLEFNPSGNLFFIGLQLKESK